MEENRGLRLKNPVLQSSVANEDIRNGNDAGNAVNSSSRVVAMSSQETPENFFNEAGYVAAGTLGPHEDPYRRNKFNQAASDRIASNRDIPDTRMAQYVF